MKKRVFTSFYLILKVHLIEQFNLLVLMQPGELYMNFDGFEGGDYESELRFWVRQLTKLLTFLGIPDFLRGWGTLKIFLKFCLKVFHDLSHETGSQYTEASFDKTFLTSQEK